MKIIRLAILALATLLHGCSMTPVELTLYEEAWYMVGNDPSGAISKLEQAQKSDPTISSEQVYNRVFCEAYFKLRRFDKATECNEGRKNNASAKGYFTMDGKYGRSTRVQYFYLKSAIALELGDFQSAYDLGSKAVRENRRDMDEPESQLIGQRDSGTLLANTAIAAYQIGKPEHAVELIELIQELDMPFGTMELPRDRVHKNSQQARAYLAMHEYEKAQQALMKSLGSTGAVWRVLGAVASIGVTEAMGAGDEAINPFYVDKFFMQTKICFELGDYGCATRGYDSLISGEYGERLAHLPDTLKKEKQDAASLLKRPAVLYIALYDRGTIARKQGNHEQAVEYYKQAIDVIEAQRATINTEASKIGFVGDKEGVYSDTVALLIKLERYNQAFIYAERAKARALVDTLAARQGIGNTVNDDQTQLLLSEIQTAELQLADKGYTGDRKQRSTDRALLRKRQQSLINAQPELASLVTVSAPNLNELLKLLPKDETLIEYYGNDDSMFAFVLSSKGVGAIRLKTKGLSSEIAAFRTSLTDPNDASYRRAAESLYAKLFAPLTRSIKTSSVTVVPHGSLHYLPFNALMSDGRYIIDSYKLRTLPSASVMKFLNKKTTASNELLVLGNPDVDDASLDLPGAQLEAQAVARTFERSQLLLRKQATETVVKKNGAGFKRLHFASHGIFDAEKPMSSGLMLAADDSNDGMLTVSELYDLKLDADLITLSACETALGKIANGDDVVGFTRGFLYAGASSIVSSLWKVDDAATNKLMQKFYIELKSRDKRSALRNAQLELKKIQRHPYYWAAFQLTGSVN